MACVLPQKPWSCTHQRFSGPDGWLSDYKTIYICISKALFSKNNIAGWFHNFEDRILWSFKPQLTVFTANLPSNLTRFHPSTPGIHAELEWFKKYFWHTCHFWLVATGMLCFSSNMLGVWYYLPLGKVNLPIVSFFTMLRIPEHMIKIGSVTLVSRLLLVSVWLTVSSK